VHCGRTIVASVAAAVVALVTSSAHAQDPLDALKQKCDAYGFARGTPEHADCVQKLDAQRAQMRCQAIVQRAHQVCSKEFADLVSPAAAAGECGAAQETYQQYCR
jgi:hypothetical protein